MPLNFHYQRKDTRILTNLKVCQRFKISLNFFFSRHYGALQGLDKQETVNKYGKDKVNVWRR
jgi:bisphosphoglycerate-dependent phosphoglycerate mutase